MSDLGLTIVIITEVVMVATMVLSQEVSYEELRLRAHRDGGIGFPLQGLSAALLAHEWRPCWPGHGVPPQERLGGREFLVHRGGRRCEVGAGAGSLRALALNVRLRFERATLRAGANFCGSESLLIFL